jgi:hypothetical protein
VEIGETEGLTQDDQERIHRIKEKLDIVLPSPMLESLSVLGREPLLPRTLHRDTSIKRDFEGTHLGDEFIMIDAVNAHYDQICDVLFPGDAPIEVTYKGQSFSLDKNSFKTDIQWLIMGSDIGKAGSSIQNREVVSMLFNDILIRDGHKQWLIENGKSDLYPNITDMPISLATQITGDIASKSGIDQEKINRISINDSRNGVLEQYGFNSDTTSMRAIHTAHIAMGEAFIDRLIVNPREEMLLRLSLCHHLSQGNVPDCVTKGVLDIEGGGLRLAVFLELLDKTDAFANRSGLDAKAAANAAINTTNKSTRIANGSKTIDIIDEFSKLNELKLDDLATSLRG